MGMNVIIITGRLTSDPELKYTQGGKAYAKFSLAVERKFKNKQGEKETDFIPVVFWDKTAEIAGEYLRKGHMAGVTGELRMNTYENAEGKKVKNYEVWGNALEFLETKKSSGGSSERGSSDNESSFSKGGDEVSDDEFPF